MKAAFLIFVIFIDLASGYFSWYKTLYPIYCNYPCYRGDECSKKIKCLPCPAGHHCIPTASGNRPTKCREGTYMPHDNHTSFDLGCLLCGDGTYTDEIGATKCKICPVGHHCYLSGWSYPQVRPVLCPGGTYQDQVGQSDCKICKAGTYTDKWGSTQCKPCPIGTQQPRIEYVAKRLSTYKSGRDWFHPERLARTSCGRCVKGKYSEKKEAIECKTCPKGHYCPSDGTRYPLKCPARKYQDQTGQTSCKWCEPGFYSIKEGAIKCKPCPAGNKCERGFPIQCPEKNYSPEESDKCLKCPRKHFCPIPSLAPIIESNNRVTKKMIRKAAELADETYHRKHSKGKTVYGFVEYRWDYIVVALRGSDTVEDWLTNSLVSKKEYHGCSGCQVHTGFLNSYNIIRRAILQKVAILKQEHPKAKILVAGHSLGGAKGSLAAYELSMRGYYVDFVTFGSPRPGNVVFSKNVNRAIRGFNLRVTFRDDIVTVNPPRTAGFSHVGKEIHFTDQGTMHEVGYADYRYSVMWRNSFSDHRMKNGYRWLR